LGALEHLALDPLIVGSYALDKHALLVLCRPSRRGRIVGEKDEENCYTSLALGGPVYRCSTRTDRQKRRS
jgi:hypothetical protein